MLCGIGGKTIEEAQRRLTISEFNRWVEYRNKRGTLNLGRRIERAAALTVYHSTQRKKTSGEDWSLWDFMPHEEEPELSLDSAMAHWE